jgi:glycosyltransferase involved in cell wall biosynthesis
VTDESGILVPPEDPDALAAATTMLIESDERRHAMGLEGRRVAEQRFDLRLTCAAMESIFRDAL